MLVNHKRVARILSEDRLIAAARVEPIRKTTRRDPLLNLAASMHVTGINQVWGADITHLRLRREFAFLAVVVDKFSRRVLGWALDRNLTSRLTLAALKKAIEDRNPGAGLVHHSDRGPQYLHSGYLRLLRKHGMVPSVSRPGTPGDNANCESFFGL
jgi:transposase InsO family protein